MSTSAAIQEDGNTLGQASKHRDGDGEKKAFNELWKYLKREYQQALRLCIRVGKAEFSLSVFLKAVSAAVVTAPAAALIRFPQAESQEDGRVIVVDGYDDDNNNNVNDDDNGMDFFGRCETFFHM